VNEASCVIQEAAHEDANIIFGAVVDPSLTGKVKITVIATGFERKGAGRGVHTSALPTPVDLSSYTAHLNARAAEAAAAAAAPATAAPAAAPAVVNALGQAPYGAPPLTVNRRPALDLSLPMAAAGGGGATRVADTAFESPLDVPAFLRRQS